VLIYPAQWRCRRRLTPLWLRHRPSPLLSPPRHIPLRHLLHLLTIDNWVGLTRSRATAPTRPITQYCGFKPNNGQDNEDKKSSHCRCHFPAPSSRRHHFPALLHYPLAAAGFHPLLPPSWFQPPISPFLSPHSSHLLVVWALQARTVIHLWPIKPVTPASRDGNLGMGTRYLPGT
jgi:hypothetical protein